jgi:hypothetical protein
MKIVSISLSLTLLFGSCAQTEKSPKEIKQAVAVQKDFHLDDFLTDNQDLDSAVNTLFATLDDTAIVAQLLMPAVGRYGDEESTIDALVKSRKIGGLLLYENTMYQLGEQVQRFDRQLIESPLLVFSRCRAIPFQSKDIGNRKSKKSCRNDVD